MSTIGIRRWRTFYEESKLGNYSTRPAQAAFQKGTRPPSAAGTPIERTQRPNTNWIIAIVQQDEDWVRW
jgi:hypothetical protein